MKRIMLLPASVLIVHGCTNDSTTSDTVSAAYVNYSGRDDLLSGGMKMIPVDTPKEAFRIMH